MMTGILRKSGTTSTNQSTSTIMVVKIADVTFPCTMSLIETELGSLALGIEAMRFKRKQWCGRKISGAVSINGMND